MIHLRLLVVLNLVLAAGCAGSSRTASSQPVSSADSQPPTTGTSTPARSTIPGYTEFYRMLRIDAVEELELCYPTSDPKGEPLAYGVERDLDGRPVRVTRFFFGNPDTREAWTTLKIEYAWYPSTGTSVQRRSYFGPSNAPVSVRGSYGEEILYHGERVPVMRRLLDQQGKPFTNVNGVTRSIYKVETPGVFQQEWFYGNGKQYAGTGTDSPYHQFAPLDDGIFFRRFEVNRNGDLLREEAWGLDKLSRPFPGGELVRAYELNDCGQPTRVVFLTEKGRPMANKDGIATEKYRYDDHGRVVEWRAFGLTGEPAARSADGAAAALFTYRPFDGVLLSTVKFDAHGNEIP